MDSDVYFYLIFLTLVRAIKILLYSNDDLDMGILIIDQGLEPFLLDFIDTDNQSNHGFRLQRPCITSVRFAMIIKNLKRT